MAERCLGTKANGERCKRNTKDKSGYCHDHIDQATKPKYRSHAGDSDDDDAKTVASSRSRPVTYKRDRSTRPQLLQPVELRQALFPVAALLASAPGEEENDQHSEHNRQNNCVLHVRVVAVLRQVGRFE